MSCFRLPQSQALCLPTILSVQYCPREPSRISLDGIHHHCEISDQPNYRGTPIEENVLLSALERKFNSGGHTLNTFMRDLLKTDNEASSLNFCSCFSKIVDHYELEVSVSEII